MSEQREFPPDVCTECYRSKGEHAPDCNYREKKEAVDTLLQEITANINSTEGAKVDDEFITLCLKEAEDKFGIKLEQARQSGQIDSLISGVADRVMIKLGEYAQVFLRLEIQLSDMREKLVRNYYETIEALRKETEDKEWETEKLKKIGQFDHIIKQILDLKKTIQQRGNVVTTIDSRNYESEKQKSEEEIKLIQDEIDDLVKFLVQND